MKYRSLQYNTAQELESQEYEVTCSVDGMNKCLWPTLSTLEMSTVGCSAKRRVPIVYCLCSGSDHTSVTTASATVATAARILPTSSGRVWATAQSRLGQSCTSRRGQVVWGQENEVVKWWGGFSPPIYVESSKTSTNLQCEHAVALRLSETALL